MKEWLKKGVIQKLVLVIVSAATNEVLERSVGVGCVFVRFPVLRKSIDGCLKWIQTKRRWQKGKRGFDSRPCGRFADSDCRKAIPAKPEKVISAEIGAIIRQITSSVTFLPLYEEPGG